ncbi:MAG: IspD/TarI family cytidylyltransferase [Paludibacteraceae bacterium]|nr:IspD/TarI family cytidylyltransferase [Paludibacteraceae bacterium]MEE1069494.1 IspD/TarI family cytidylyltransferase [Paludibacteraceae bacterium]
MRNIAIILAGGVGNRVGGDKPKQLLPLADGRTILEHSVDAFEQAPSIDEIAIVMHPDYSAEVQGMCEQNDWQKVTKIIPGGSERWESSWHAIVAYMDEDEESALWFHDAARPFVSQRILADVALALETHPAVTVAVPVTETLYRVERRRTSAGENEWRVEGVPARSEYMRAQTPQAFRMGVVASAYMKAIADEAVIATDDVGIVRKYAPKQSIYIVMGDEDNRKITFAQDLKA